MKLTSLSCADAAARGPMRLFAKGCSCAASARRGKGSPPVAHAVAVSASLRLHCAARSGVAPPNSLRSLRSLRSNNRGESVHEARAARAPTPALRCSSPPKSCPAGSPCREVHGWWCSLQTPPPCLQRHVRAGRGASLRRSQQSCDCPAVRGLVARRSTHCVRYPLSAQTNATSQWWKRAARVATSPVLLGASEARRTLPARAFARADRGTYSGRRDH